MINIWMNTLAKHYTRMQRLHPEDQLLILFDIDGTIVDTRHIVYGTLLSFDLRHGTAYFRHLKLSDISFHEKHFDQWVARLDLQDDIRRAVVEWYIRYFWSPDALISTHQPYDGVMEVIRWFQRQPRTQVGLNTGRSESIRRETLDCLNHVGEFHGVMFEDRLLYMSPYAWGEKILTAKMEGIRHFQQAGFRIVAFVDNEPDNLAAVESMPDARDVLLLHADTIFASGRHELPKRAVSGNRYDAGALGGR